MEYKANTFQLCIEHDNIDHCLSIYAEWTIFYDAYCDADGNRGKRDCYITKVDCASIDDISNSMMAEIYEHIYDIIG